MTSPDISPAQGWDIHAPKLIWRALGVVAALQAGGLAAEAVTADAEPTMIVLETSSPVEVSLSPHLPVLETQAIRSTIIPPSAGILPAEVTQPVCEQGGIANVSTITWLPQPVARWHPYISETAAWFGFPPEIQEVLTTFESLGHPSELSRAGAVGLVQIMPDTAASLSSQLGLPPLDRTDPASNLYMSARYIRNYLDTMIDTSRGFDEEVIRQIAIVYNGGPVRLRNYLNGGGYDSLPDETKFYSDHVAWAWNERNLPVSEALNHYLTYEGARELLERATTVGIPPC